MIPYSVLVLAIVFAFGVGLILGGMLGISGQVGRGE